MCGHTPISYIERETCVLYARDLYWKLPRSHYFPVADQNRFDDAVQRRAHRVLHLHRLEDDQRIARRDLPPSLDQYLQHLSRHGRICRSLLRRDLWRRMPGGPFDHERPERRMDIKFVARFDDTERPLYAVNLDSNDAGEAL